MREKRVVQFIDSGGQSTLNLNSSKNRHTLSQILLRLHVCVSKSTKSIYL